MTAGLPILLADEHALFRAVVRAALEDDLGVTVAECSTGDGVLREVDRLGPEVVLLSDQLTVASGERVCAVLTARSGSPRVLVLGTEADPAGLVRALDSGADGFASRGGRLEDLLAATRAVLAGQAWVPPDKLGEVLRHYVARRRVSDEAAGRIQSLSPREREVLVLLAGGRNHREIAAQLVIAPQTARTHIQNVLAKLGVHSRLEASALAFESGLLDGDDLESRAVL